MPRQHRKSYAAVCEALSRSLNDDSDEDSDSASDDSESHEENTTSQAPKTSVQIADDAVTPDCMAKLQPKVVLEDCLSPNKLRNTASPGSLNKDWKSSPSISTQRETKNSGMQRHNSDDSDLRHAKLRELKAPMAKEASPLSDLMCRIISKKIGTEVLPSASSTQKLPGDKSPEVAASPESLNPDSPGDSSAREVPSENGSTSTPQKDSLSSVGRNRLTSSPSTSGTPSKMQFTHVRGSPYPPGSPQMSPVVVLRDCLTPPHSTRLARAQRMAARQHWHVDADEADEMEQTLEEEDDDFPEPLSTADDNFFGRRIEATVEIHGETLAESSLYYSLSSSSKKKPTTSARASRRYKLRNAKPHYKNGCVINDNDEITFISSTRTSAKELIKEARRRERSLHFTPSPVYLRNKRFKGETKTENTNSPSRISLRQQRRRGPLTSSPEEPQDIYPTAEDAPSPEGPMEDADEPDDLSHFVFDEEVICPVEDGANSPGFQGESPMAELPHASWSLSPPTREQSITTPSSPVTNPKATELKSPPIREGPAVTVFEAQPITDKESARGSKSPSVTEQAKCTRDESPLMAEVHNTDSPETPTRVDHSRTTESDMPAVAKQERKGGSAHSPITEQKSNSGSEHSPIKEQEPKPVSGYPPITAQKTEAMSKQPPITQEDGTKNVSAQPPITEEKTKTQSELPPITVQDSKAESEPPITSQAGLSKSSPLPNISEKSGHPTNTLASPVGNSHQTIEVQSPSSSNKSATSKKNTREEPYILEEEEDGALSEPESEPLSYVTVARRGRGDTPLPGRRLSSRVAQALQEDASMAAAQLSEKQQSAGDEVQSQVQTNVCSTKLDTVNQGSRKSSRHTSKLKKIVVEEDRVEEGGASVETDNQNNTGDKKEMSGEECSATSDVAIVTDNTDVNMVTSMSPEKPMNDISEAVAEETVKNVAASANVSKREANFSDTTKGEDIVILGEVKGEEQTKRRHPRLRRSSTKVKPQVSSAVKLRKGRGRKQEEDIEVIYKNKNYKAPEQKTYETIYEDPVVRKKTGEELLVGRPMRRRVSFRNFYYPKKMNKKKASKNVKRFRRKSLEGVTVDEKLINLDRQMIGISPAKFCLPGDQMMFQFASEEPLDTGDLVTVKEEPLDLFDEEAHQDLDLSGVGPLDDDVAPEFVKSQENGASSQNSLLKEGTEPQFTADSTNSSGRPGRKRRRSSIASKVMEDESQISSELEDNVPKTSKAKKSRRKSSYAKRANTEESSESSSTMSESTTEDFHQEVLKASLAKHVSLSTSEGTTTAQQDGEVTKSRKRGRRKSCRVDKPNDIAEAAEAQSAELDSVSLVLDAVASGRYLSEPSDVVTVNEESSHAALQEELSTEHSRKEVAVKRRRRSSVIPAHKEDIQNAGDKCKVQVAKGKGQRAQIKGQNGQATVQDAAGKDQDIESTVQTTECIDHVEEVPAKGRKVKQQSRRRSLLLSQQKSSTEDTEERVAEVLDSEEGKDASSQISLAEEVEIKPEAVKKRTSRRRSGLPPKPEESSSTTEHQNSTGDESSTSTVSETVRKRNRRRSTISTTKQNSVDDVPQLSQMTNEQTQEEGYSTESSVTDFVVRRRSRRKSVLLQQSSSEEGSQQVKALVTETDKASESSVTASVAKRRSRRKSIAVKQEGSSSEESSEPPCELPLPGSKSVKSTKSRRQAIVPDSNALETSEFAIGQSEQGKDIAVSDKCQERNEIQLNIEPDLPYCSSQESVSSQSVDGLESLTDEDLTYTGRRKRQRRKSVLLKEFKWAGESPPGKTAGLENVKTDEEMNQIEETVSSLLQQCSEEVAENVQDSQETGVAGDSILAFQNKETKEGETREVESDTEVTILPAKKGKRSLNCNKDEKDMTNSELLPDTQPQVPTKRTRRKSVSKQVHNGNEIVSAVSADDVQHDAVNGNKELEKDNNDAQRETQSVRKQKRKRSTLMSVRCAEELPANGLEDNSVTMTTGDIQICTQDNQVRSVDEREEANDDEVVFKNQRKRKGRRQSTYIRQTSSQKMVSPKEKEIVNVSMHSRPLVEEDIVTKEDASMDDRETEVDGQPKRKVRRQSARFRRVTPQKIISPKTSPVTNDVLTNESLFEEDFVTNEDTFIDKEQIESLIDSITEGDTPVGSPCQSVSPKDFEADVKEKPGRKKGKTAQKKVAPSSINKAKKLPETETLTQVKETPCRKVIKPLPSPVETVLSPTSREQGRQVSSLFSVLSSPTSQGAITSPYLVSQPTKGAMPAFKSLVKNVVSPDSTINCKQTTLDTSKGARKATSQAAKRATSHANKASSLKQMNGNRSTSSTPSCSSKPDHFGTKTPRTGTKSFSCSNTSSTWNDSVSGSAQSQSFAFAKAYSVKQHWAKRFANTKDTYLNKFKMFAFGSPSQSNAEGSE